MNSAELAAWKAKREAALQRANQKRAERAAQRGNTGAQQYSNNRGAAQQSSSSAGSLSDFMPARSR